MTDDPPERDVDGPTSEDRSSGVDESSIGDESDGDESDANDPYDDEFAAELESARELLEGDDIKAIHLGVVRDDEVDTTFAQRGTDPQQEGLLALSLLAAHVRLVANEAGVEASTVAGDAATLAGQVEEIPTDLDDVDS